MPCFHTASSRFYFWARLRTDCMIMLMMQLVRNRTQRATVSPRPPPPWGALPPVSPPPWNPLGAGPTAARQPPHLGRAVGGCAMANPPDGRVRYGETTFCYAGAHAARTPLYNPRCPKLCDNRGILSQAIIMIIVWGKGESGTCLSSAGSHHHPRGGLLPPCPLPRFTPSRPPNRGRPARARTDHRGGVRSRAHWAPLPIASFGNAAPPLLAVRALPTPFCSLLCYHCFVPPRTVVLGRFGLRCVGATSPHRPSHPRRVYFSVLSGTARPLAALSGYFFYTRGSAPRLRVGRSWGLSAPCRGASPECFS